MPKYLLMDDRMCAGVDQRRAADSSKAVYFFSNRTHYSTIQTSCTQGRIHTQLSDAMPVHIFFIRKIKSQIILRSRNKIKSVRVF